MTGDEQSIGLGPDSARPPTPPPPPSDRAWIRVSDPQRVPLLVALACAGLLIIGGFGPWVKLGPISAAGTEGDGWFVIAGGALAAGLLARLNSRRGQSDGVDWMIPIAGAVGAIVVLLDIIEISDSELVTVGWGAWAAAIGGIVLIGTSIYLMSPTTGRLTVGIIAAVAVAGGGVAAGQATSDETNSSSAADSNEPSIFDDEEAEEEAPPAPKVRVTEQGFSQTDSGTSYAALLRNPSPDLAAMGVEVTINLLNAAGTVVSTETASVAAIPPKATFGVGGTGYVEGEEVAKIQVRAKATEGSGKSIRLTRADSIRIVDSEFSRDARAQITNTGRKPLSSIGDVFFVFRNDEGALVGGSQTFPTADVPPGSKAAVETTDVPKAATRAEVHIDPEE